MTNAHRLARRCANSGAAVPFQIKKEVTVSGDTVVPFVVPGGMKVEITGWRFVSLDTTAANVKLKKDTTDLTAVVAKGTTDNAVVQGASLDVDAAQLIVGNVLKINSSATARIMVYIECVWANA